VRSEQETLEAVVGHLERLSIPYMVTGSMASSHHGRPRTTHDADIVIEPSGESLESLLGAVAASGMYVSANAAREALRRRRQFNVIDTDSGFKVDLIIRKDRPFSREEFARRRAVALTARLTASIASPEDSILSKLEWARKAGESERQIEDAAAIVVIVGDVLDVAYIERWVDELGVAALWRRISPR
jgi:hypothetical protein